MNEHPFLGIQNKSYVDLFGDLLSAQDEHVLLMVMAGAPSLRVRFYHEYEPSHIVRSVEEAEDIVMNEMIATYKPVQHVPRSVDDFKIVVERMTRRILISTGRGLANTLLIHPKHLSLLGSPRKQQNCAGWGFHGEALDVEVYTSQKVPLNCAILLYRGDGENGDVLAAVRVKSQIGLRMQDAMEDFYEVIAL